MALLHALSLPRSPPPMQSMDASAIGAAAVVQKEDIAQAACTPRYSRRRESSEYTLVQQWTERAQPMHRTRRRAAAAGRE